jgi:hypothetical protein
MSAQLRFAREGWWHACLLVGVACSSEPAPNPGGAGSAGSTSATSAGASTTAGSGGISGGAAGSTAVPGPGGSTVSGGASAGGAATGGGGAATGGTALSGGGAAAGGGGTASGGSAGAAAGGGYQKLITVDTSANGANVSADVERYPLAVQLDATNFDFTQAATTGTDVHFEKLDGTPLPHSIEHWDATGKTAALWVKLDKVVGNMAGQSIRMLWGQAGAAVVADSKAVFSTADGFYGVWHLSEDGSTTAGGYKDSSQHEAHATGVNMLAGSSIAARVGRGINLDNKMGQNTARWVRVDGEKASAFNPGPPITVSVWALAHSYPIYSYETIMSKGDTSWSLQRVQYEETGYQSCLLAGGQPGYHFCIYDFAKQPRVTEQWLHFMVVLQAPNMTLYINGQPNSQGSGTGWNQGNHPLGIGNQTQFDGRRQWDGIIDEARVMQAARSPSWAKLEFETQKSGQKAITYGATEARP